MDLSSVIAFLGLWIPCRPGSMCQGSRFLSFLLSSILRQSGQNTPGKNASWQSQVLMSKSALLVISLRQQAEVICCEIQKSSTLVQFIFPCIIVPFVLETVMYWFYLVLFSLTWLCHCFLFLSYRSVHLLPGSSLWTKPPPQARKVVCIVLVFFCST